VSERRPFAPGAMIVTGGGGAIGGAIARVLSDGGAGHVLVADVAADAAAATADEVGGEAVTLDVSDPDAIDRFSDDLARDGVRVGGLVHAAAVFGPSSFPEVGWDEWSKTLSINLMGAYRLTTTLRRCLSEGASIVAVTSVEGFHVLSTAGASTPHYAASKGGLQMLTRTLAADLAPRGVRVNAVAPGYIATPMNEQILSEPERRAFIEDRVPLGWRVGTPEDVTGPVLFLLSDAARYVTGTTIVVDGGLTLGTVRRMETPASMEGS
jgi:NAD(P)-dependent dehydrogenase (short-subunit alcohol dehydrogenase family)